MSFTLTMSGIVVGRSELETRDPARRMVRGVFRPGLGYDLTQPIFALFTASEGDTEALARYRKARSALKLQLTDSAGTPVRAREIHIRPDAAAAEGTGGLLLEVETDDPAVWNATSQ
jgi:hypothetical protein